MLFPLLCCCLSSCFFVHAVLQTSSGLQLENIPTSSGYAPSEAWLSGEEVHLLKTPAQKKSKIFGVPCVGGGHNMWYFPEA